MELPPRGGAARIVRALPATTTTAFAAVS